MMRELAHRTADSGRIEISLDCATASADCCLVEAVASRTPAALGCGAAFWLNRRRPGACWPNRASN
jgi:hypothetical protein